MKLTEIIEPNDDEPLILVLIRQRMNKGQRVAWYVKSGDRSVPVWIHDWHSGIKSFADKTVRTWTIRGYRNFSAEYRHIREDDIDNFTLLPGKTKNTLQLKRIANASSLAEGIGSNLMNYIDFAEKFYTGVTRRLYDQLANDLFVRGYTFKHSPIGKHGRFEKLEGSDTIRVTFSGIKQQRPSKNAVTVCIMAYNPVTGLMRPKYQNFELEDMTDSSADLDFILSGKDH